MSLEAEIAHGDTNREAHAALRCQNLFTQDAGLHRAVCLLHGQRKVSKSLLHLKNQKKLHFDLIVHSLSTGDQMCMCVYQVCWCVHSWKEQTSAAEQKL